MTSSMRDSSSTSEIDVLRLTNLVASDIVLSHVGNDLILKVSSTGQQIEIDEHFYSTTSNYGIERIEFADGTSWDRAKINSEAWYRGTAGADSMSGSSFNDTFYGGTRERQHLQHDRQRYVRVCVRRWQRLHR